MIRPLRPLLRVPPLKWVLDNPLFIREVRRRMRGRLFAWSLIGYLIALGGVSCALMLVSYPLFEVQAQSARDMVRRVGQIGKTLFIGMQFVEGFIALLIAPMLTAGLATQEKERDTFDFLRVTTLGSWSFVVGCLLTTASFLLLVFSCTLPILGLTFIFGGVSMEQILSFNLTLFLAALAISSWGVFNSTSYSRSRSVQGSLVLLLFMIGFFGFQLLRVVRGWMTGPWGGSSWPAAIRYLLGVVAPLLAVTLFFAAAAARRLYEPNNRLLSYKQFTFFYLLSLGAIAGTFLWKTSSLSAQPFSAPQAEYVLAIYYFAAWVLMIGAILLFSTGRVEMGDEVWKIRLRWPWFRRLNETVWLYAFYFVIWLLPPYVLARYWSAAPDFLMRYFFSITILAAALGLVWAASVALSLLTENRNRCAAGVIALLAVLWGIAPLLGFTLAEMRLPAGLDRPLWMRLLSTFLRDASPFSAVYRLWKESASPTSRYILPDVEMALLALLFLLPLASRRLRARFNVAYDWPTGPEPGPKPRA